MELRQTSNKNATFTVLCSITKRQDDRKFDWTRLLVVGSRESTN